MKNLLSSVTMTAFTFSLLLIPETAVSVPNSKIMGHRWLVSAIKNNRSPSGYLDLKNCKLDKNISDLPPDRRTYRISFDDNFAYDPENGNLSTIMNILYQQTKELGGTPILMSRPATIILTSKPATDFISYQIVMTHNEKTMMQLYKCSWDKAVFLWKPQLARFAR
ncbi:hypothetical protein [Endozoicomonas sp. OPT23]|uniref:hypothetical protein n=1 Tax=Endozoicomonas sp. OPT23 TaxID=2072845 RepID=UPI00129B530C|nr:hypothetical protein [Endozoicomonas sp. OPT23]